MNVLLSGHLGFIGKNLLRKLKEHNHNVIGIDIKEGNDVCDIEYVDNIFKENKFDVVIHLAAKPGVGYSIPHSQHVLHNNIIGFDIMAKTAIKYNVPHFIYASSSSVYGDGDINAQRSPYAVSKRTNELQAAMYSKLYDNIKFSGLRFFTVYGNGIRDDLAISKFIRAMRENEPIYIYGDGTKARDFTYVDDICEGILRIMISERQWRNETFDIGYGRSTTVNDLVGILKEIINPSFDKIIYEDEKKYDVNMTLADTRKMEEWFGFKPRYDIESGLKTWIKK